MTLVIMAAGIGSRFGGLKQVEEFGDNGEFILDYSIYDAIKVGFNKVVFIIKEENYNLFKNTIGKRIENKIKTYYAFQKNNNLPSNFKNRIKPLGTGHAILSCKDIVKEDFLVINADDFYGEDAFKVASKFLKKKHNNNCMAMVGYKVINTLTENGSVKRGICEQKNNKLTKITESSVKKQNEKIICTSLSDNSIFLVDKNTLVSMNMFIFTPLIFSILEKDIIKFFEENKTNTKNSEFLIPDVIYKNINNNNINVEILKTTAKWHGITYKKDKEKVLQALKNLIEKGKYPNKLWE